MGHGRELQILEEWQALGGFFTTLADQGSARGMKCDMKIQRSGRVDDLEGGSFFLRASGSLAQCVRVTVVGGW